jgi:hypothetical protein
LFVCKNLFHVVKCIFRHSYSLHAFEYTRDRIKARCVPCARVIIFNYSFISSFFLNYSMSPKGIFKYHTRMTVIDIRDLLDLCRLGLGAYVSIELDCTINSIRGHRDSLSHTLFRLQAIPGAGLGIACNLYKL